MASVSIPKRTYQLFQDFQVNAGFSSAQEAMCALLVVCRELGRDEESGLRIKPSEGAECSVSASDLFEGNMDSVRYDYADYGAVEIEVEDRLLSRANDPLIQQTRAGDYGQTHERLSAMMSLGIAIYNNMPREGKDKICVPVVDKRNPLECAIRSIHVRAEL